MPNTSYKYNLITINNQKVKSFCTRCSNITNHSIIANYEEIYHDSEYCFESCTNFQIIQCNGCEEIRFRKLYSNSEELEMYTDSSGKYDYRAIEKEEIYPERQPKRKPINMEELHLIPIKCRKVYIETNFALKHELCLLGAVGLRALSEAICIDQIQNRGFSLSNYDNLFKKINFLKNEGVLSQGSKDILHTIRTIGNDSIHQIEMQNIDLLNLAFKVLEDLLRSLYIYPKEFQEFTK